MINNANVHLATLRYQSNRKIIIIITEIGYFLDLKIENAYRNYEFLTGHHPRQAAAFEEESSLTPNIEG